MNLPVIALDARLVGGTHTGDSTYWTGLLYGLSRIEPDAKILLFSNAARPQNIPNNRNFSWVHLPSRSSRWWSFVTFPLAARKVKAAAIHTQYALSPLVGRHGFTTIHDVSFFIGPEWFNPKDGWIMRASVPAAVKRARSVFTVSETARQELAKYVPTSEGKTVVTYNACPPWIRRQDPADALPVLKSLGLERPYLLTVGTRWPRKNMKLAIEAAEGLPAALPHKLIVTGKPGWGEEKTGHRTHFTGYLSEPELSAVYSMADLYLAPSFHEGFGIPLLEAFQCGCPVLCSQGGALPEVAGDSAAVETSWEPQNWTARIASLIADSSNLHLLRERGFQRERMFSWEKTARLTLAAYLKTSG